MSYMIRIMSHIRALQALNIELKTYSQLLVSMLTKKIPHVLMAEISKSMNEKNEILIPCYRF